MNDYWNDPPEPPEPPACPRRLDAQACDGSGEYLYEGKHGPVFSCDTCGYQWTAKPAPEPDPPEVNDEKFSNEQAPSPKTCPHGRTGECDACDHLSDIAYDTARERRTFGR